MNNERPFIFPFKTPGGKYIYDVNKNVVLQLKEPVFDALTNSPGKAKNSYKLCSKESENNIEQMKSNGYLSSKKVKEIAHPVDEILPFHLQNKLHKITLQITQQCNFRCQYCCYSDDYENRHHSNRKMSFETAKKGIDFLISHSGETTRIDIGFYGGEPLLEFDFIKQCIQYGKAQAEGKKLSFSITTNGSLINEKTIDYLVQQEVSLTISLDGPREIHDKNRKFAGSGCGTFDRVMQNIEIIKAKYPDYLQKMLFSVVIDTENDFSCMNEFFLSCQTINESGITATLINDMYKKTAATSREEFFEKRNYEQFKLYLALLNRLDMRHISKVSMNGYDSLKQLNDKLKPTEALPDKFHHSGPCVPGALRLFMDVNGDFFPCERVSEASKTMKIGNVNTGFEIEKVRKILNIGTLTQDQCKNCWAVRFCGLCASFADDLDNLSTESKLKHCNNSRLSAAENLKDYCMLKEFGFDFKDKNKPTFICEIEKCNFC
jgi:uncharacterized protein